MERPVWRSPGRALDGLALEVSPSRCTVNFRLQTNGDQNIEDRYTQNTNTAPRALIARSGVLWVRPDYGISSVHLDKRARVPAG